MMSAKDAIDLPQYNTRYRCMPVEETLKVVKQIMPNSPRRIRQEYRTRFGIKVPKFN